MLTQRRGSTDYAERRAMQMPSARRAASFTNRHAKLIGWIIAAAAAVVFCGPMGG